MKKISSIAVVVLSALMITICVVACVWGLKERVKARELQEGQEVVGVATENEVADSDVDPLTVLRNGEELEAYRVVEGYVYYCWPSTGAMAPYGSLHSEGLTNLRPVYRDETMEVVFDKDNGKITYYALGKVIFESELPKGTDFCGVNPQFGTFYRTGDTVYLINNEYRTEEVAKGVAEVVLCDYPYNHEVDSGITEYRPLFLMTDGSLKVWDCQTLKPAEYEGGYVELNPIC